MRTHLTIHLLAALLTLAAEQPQSPIQVPASVTIEAGRMAIIEARAVGPVRWAVVPRGTHGPDLVRIDDATGKRVAFVAARPGTYTLFAVTVADGQVSEFVECIIVVTGDAGPGPGPGPDPQPPPTPYLREFEAAWRADKEAGSPDAALAQLTALYDAVAAAAWPTWESLVDHIKDRYDRTMPPAAAIKLRAEIAGVLNRELFPRARSWDQAVARATLTRVSVALKALGGGPGPSPGPDPADPLWQAVSAAWTAETAADKRDHAKRLASFYRDSAEMARTLQVPRAVDLHMAMVARRRTLGIDALLPAVRQSLTEHFDRSLPRSTDAPLDVATREKAAELFTRVAALLERLQ